MENKIALKNSAILVSLACNLNCKLCAVSAPYSKSNAFQTAETLIGYVKKYFSIVDYVDTFCVSGGEPFIYKQLPEFVSMLLDFSEHYGQIEIHTNGTVIPSDELLNQVKKYGKKLKRILIDNYGENLSTKAFDVAALFDKHNIPYSLRDYYSENAHCNGWVNFGDLTKEINSDKQAEDFFSRCNYPQKLGLCNMIYKGAVIACCPMVRRYIDGTLDYSEYIDLNDESMSIEQQQKKLLDIQNVKSFATCAYCPGFFDESPRFKPAEQLTLDEIRKIRNV